MEHTCRLVVRTYECDGNHHVNNAVYLNYLEAARMEFLIAAGIDYLALREAGYGLVVVRVVIDYKRPASFGDVLTVVTKPLKLSSSSGVFGQQILRGEELLTQAEVTWACVDQNGRPAPLPPRFRSPALGPA